MLVLVLDGSQQSLFSGFGLAAAYIMKAVRESPTTPQIVQGIQVRRTTAMGETPANPATIMMTPATGESGRAHSLASCSIMASSVGATPKL